MFNQSARSLGRVENEQGQRARIALLSQPSVLRERSGEMSSGHAQPGACTAFNPAPPGSVHAGFNISQLALGRVDHHAR